MSPTPSPSDRDTAIEAAFARKLKHQTDQLASYSASINGARYGGWDPSRPLELSEGELRALAEAEVDNCIAFRLTPRGRFVAALNEMQACGASEAEILYGFYSRSIRDDRRPLDTKAVGQCIAILAPLTAMSAAREATAALGDLLAVEQSFKMAAE